MQQEGKEPVALTNDQVINIIQVQQAQVKELTAKVADLQNERNKLERSLLYVTTTNIGGGRRNDVQSPENGDDSQNQSSQTQLQRMLSNCLSDLSERDETLRKLKGLYMKSIVEASELKAQLSEARKSLQNVQSEYYSEIKSSPSNVNNPDPVPEPAIRLIIDEVGV